ncbi:MAG: acyl-[acyl-carrier-protein] thioesterase, partial [Clostridia bacterium]|nr:acyl-[acyl-carrier-protein] thioesterase [Clostridia bacterium]
AMRFLPKERRIRQVRAEYKKSAVLHDKMIPYLYEENDKVIIALSDDQGKPYTIVEFR